MKRIRVEPAALEAPSYDYDVFISYSSKDKTWVKDELLKRIEDAGLRAFVDFRDFDAGAPSIEGMKRGVTRCRKTLLVLTPDYVKSEWCELENNMSVTRGPANRDRRRIPLLKTRCETPLHVAHLTHIDFTKGADLDLAWFQLLIALGRPPELPRIEKEPDPRSQTLRDEVRQGRSGVRSSGISTTAPAETPTAGGRLGVWIGLIAVLAVAAAILAVVMRREAAQTTAPAPTVAAKSALDPRSIAVLPFVNMSDDKANEYFSDGISEELLNLLAKTPELQVTARTSSFSFKGKEVAIPEIARQLHVARVLEGSVRKAGNKVRITAQLIDAASDTHLWSQTYDRKLDDIFAIQDEIAADVVKHLQGTLLGAAPTVRKTDPEAYALYLQALQIGRQSTAEAFQQSDALFRQVLAIDPRYAPAWIGLAGNLVNERNHGLLSAKEAFTEAREAATKAIEIDPEYAPAHASLGYIAMAGEHDLAGGAQHMERASALDPSDPLALNTSASLLAALGRMDEALALRDEQVRRDPVNVVALYNLGLAQRHAGRLDEAIATLRTALNLSPRRGGAHLVIGSALLQKGDAAGALLEFEHESSEMGRMTGLPMAYHALGRKADSEAALTALIAKYEKSAPYSIARVYAFRGEAGKAFEWLDKAVEYNDDRLYLIVIEQFFDNIHSDPRWLPFLRKTGKAPEQLAKIQFKVTLPRNVSPPLAPR